MHFTKLTGLAILASSATAKRCINQTIPVTISARQGIFNIDVPQTSVDATTFILNMTQQGRNFTDLALAGYNTTEGTYNISTQFCVPTTGPGANSTSPTVQVLTHGIGFDKTYWDFNYADFNYSYVDMATDMYGYCTLAFDRLGIANSSHGDPLNEIQAPLEVAGTAALTMMLRNGAFPNVNFTFTKVVHVGHSFGSAQTFSLVNMYPNITDGIILTGFSMNSSFAGYFLASGNFQQANANQPLRFSNVTGAQVQGLLSQYAPSLVDYLAPISLTGLPAPQNLPNGYLVSSNEEANKYQFFYPNGYNPDILPYTEATKQPVTLGEILTLGSLPMMNNYAGPVMVINGNGDLPYCGGNCSATGGVAASIPAMVKMNFPSVADSDFAACVQPNTGHGINLHYNSTAAYTVWLDFLAQHNLASGTGGTGTNGTGTNGTVTNGTTGTNGTAMAKMLVD